MEQINYRMM